MCNFSFSNYELKQKKKKRTESKNSKQKALNIIPGHNKLASIDHADLNYTNKPGFVDQIRSHQQYEGSLLQLRALTILFLWKTSKANNALRISISFIFKGGTK